MFVVLFKLCDALAGTMTAPFVLSLGYTRRPMRRSSKASASPRCWSAALPAAPWRARCRSSRALWLAAFLQMFSNLAFVWLGFQPPSAEALTVAIIVENFTGAIGTVIFVAYLSALCRNPLHTATQYALLTALASTGRTLFSSGTGFAAAALGWPLFFLGTSLTAIPALMLMVWLQGRGHFRALDAERNGAVKPPTPRTQSAWPSTLSAEAACSWP